MIEKTTQARVVFLKPFIVFLKEIYIVAKKYINIKNKKNYGNRFEHKRTFQSDR